MGSNVLSQKITEPVCFYLALLLNLSLFFITQNFATLDGPAHLYNTTILHDLLFDPASDYRSFHNLNGNLPPNALFHFLMLSLKLAFPSFIAEKIILVSFMIFMPLLFRKIVQQFKPGSFFVLLVFPFTHFSLIYMGFYNFMLGVLFFFLCVHLYLIGKNSLGSKNKFFLFLFLIVLYFSHVFVFIIVIFFIGLDQVIDLTMLLRRKQDLRTFFRKQLFPTLIAMIPALTLCLFYLLSRPGTYQFKHLSFGTITWYYTNMGPLQAYGQQENLFCKIIGITLLILGFTHFIKRVFNFKKNGAAIFQKEDVFLATSIIMVLLSYIMPDEDGYGGYITIRFVIFALFFGVLWLACGLKKSLLNYSAIAIILAAHLVLLYKRGFMVRELDGLVKEIKKADPYIAPGSRIVTIVGSENVWQAKHFGNYLGADKAVMLFENYEADTGYFPIEWKGDRPGVSLDSSATGSDCWNSGISKELILPDYVFAFDYRNNSCFHNNYQHIIKNFKLCYSSSLVSLYKRK